MGHHPVALAETPDQKKLYAVNQGSGNVSSIDVVGQTVIQTIATGTSPVWAVVRSDSARVYVLDSGTGTVFAIDTLSDQVIGTASVGAGGNFMTYDGKLNRLYVTNPVANTLTALDISKDPPTTVFALPVAASPITVAALPDGTRVYVASGEPPSQVAAPPSLRVTVVNASDGASELSSPLNSVNTSYTYTLASGPALRPGMEIVIAGMTDAGNNGTFTLVAANAGTLYRCQ